MRNSQHRSILYPYQFYNSINFDLIWVCNIQFCIQKYYVLLCGKLWPLFPLSCPWRIAEMLPINMSHARLYWCGNYDNIKEKHHSRFMYLKVMASVIKGKLRKCHQKKIIYIHLSLSPYSHAHMNSSYNLMFVSYNLLPSIYWIDP